MIAAATAYDWIVLKFGGTSVSRRHRWDTIGRLMRERADESRRACWWWSRRLSGVTNALQAIIDACRTRRAVAPPSRPWPSATASSASSCRWTRDAPRMNAWRSLRALGRRSASRQRRLDWQAEVLAQGELLSSTLGVAYLRSQGLAVEWLDARDWLHAQRACPTRTTGRTLVGVLRVTRAMPSCARALRATRRC